MTIQQKNIPSPIWNPTQDMEADIKDLKHGKTIPMRPFQSTILNTFQIMACGVPHWLIWRFHIYSVSRINSLSVHHSHNMIRNRIILDSISDCSSNLNIACTKELRSIMTIKETHQYRHNQATHKEYDCVVLADWCDHYLLHVICVALANSWDRHLLYVLLNLNDVEARTRSQPPHH